MAIFAFDMYGVAVDKRDRVMVDNQVWYVEKVKKEKLVISRLGMSREVKSSIVQKV